MSNDKPKVELVGIDNTSEVRMQCDSLIESLQKMAPSDAFIKALFIRFGKTYEGVLSINSTVGRFTVSHQERSLPKVISALHESMLRKLKAWKKERFNLTQRSEGADVPVTLDGLIQENRRAVDGNVTRLPL